MATSAVSSKKDDGYRLKKHGKIGSSVPIGDKTLVPGASHLTLIRPKMKEGPLWFRIAPTLNKENVKEFAPVCYMDEPDLDNLTDWVRQMPAARYMGVEGGERATVLLHHPKNEAYDPWSVNPYYLLYRFAKRAFSNTKSQENRHWKPEWNSVVHGKDAGLKSPDVLYMLLAYVYENGNERYYQDNGVPLGLGENDGTILLQLPKSAGEAIVVTAGEANPEGPPGVRDYDANKHKDMLAAFNEYFEAAHKYGDVVSLKTGRVCCVHDPERFPIEQLIPGKPAKIGISTSKKGSGKKEEFSRYEAFWRKYYYFRQTKKYPVDLTAFEATIKSRIQFLSELLYVPSHEELALWIAMAFKPVAKLLQLAWTDHSEFMTDDVRKVLSLAKTVAVDGKKKPRAAAKADVTAPPQDELSSDDSPAEDEAIDNEEDDLPELPPEEGEIDDELPAEDAEGAEAEGEDVDPEEAEGAEDDLPADEDVEGDEDAEVAEDELPTEDDDAGEPAEDDLPAEDGDPDEEPLTDTEVDSDEAPLPDELEEDSLPEEDEEASQRPRSQPARRRSAAAAPAAPAEEDVGEGPPVVTPRPRSPKPVAAKPATTKPSAAKPATAPAGKPAAGKPAGYYRQPAAAPAAAPAATPAASAAAAKRDQQKAAAAASAKTRGARRTA